MCGRDVHVVIVAIARPRLLILWCEALRALLSPYPGWVAKRYLGAA